MRKYRAHIFFGLAILVALITSGLVFSWLRGAEGVDKPTTPIQMLETADIVVAKDQLNAGTKLVPEMLVVAAYPAGHLPTGHVSRFEDLTDKVLLVDLTKHEPVLLSKLSATGGRAGVAAVTDPSKRAMSVKVDEVIGVSGFIKPGDRVDVMVTIQRNNRSRSSVAKTILENIEVLAAGLQWEKSADDKEPKPVQVMTLEVDVREAEILALASTQGRLRLALRNPLNSEEVLTHGATVATLLSAFRPKSSRQVFKVEMIKGTERKTIKLRVKKTRLKK